LPPDRELAAVDNVLQSGHLAEAQTRAEHAESIWGNTAWVIPLRVEEAKIRLYRGQNSEALKLLSENWAQKIPDADVAIDRFLILSLANSRIGNRLGAIESVAQAKALCKRVPCESNKQGEIWSTEGILAFEEDRLSDAQKLFGQSLEIARATGKHFLEARDWVSLSAVSLEQYHYEDALAQSQAATEIANKIGAQQTLVIAQGNSGWAYYETGDYIRALASFNDAAASAAALGSTINEEHWLDTAGMSEARLGNLDAIMPSVLSYEPTMPACPSSKTGVTYTWTMPPISSVIIE
jgi:tetratricopeptide (TPR) repeat protein